MEGDRAMNKTECYLVFELRHLWLVKHRVKYPVNFLTSARKSDFQSRPPSVPFPMIKEGLEQLSERARQPGVMGCHCR